MFGNNTLNAVRIFQQIFGLTVDGVVGPLTWERIMTECVSGQEPRPPYPGSPLRLGSTGEAVRQVQRCLNNIGTRHPSIPRLTEDGVFGNNTQRAVQAFQRIFGLTADGVVGPVTWERMMIECGVVSRMGSGYTPGMEPGYRPGAPVRSALGPMLINFMFMRRYM
jgi:peptidoglycan hydrolase-like protein with peptidoglycan-binding domain